MITSGSSEDWVAAVRPQQGRPTGGGNRATRRIRRTLAATTALGLAVLGAILGVAVAYLAAAAILDEDIGLLKRVPVIELAVGGCARRADRHGRAASRPPTWI